MVEVGRQCATAPVHGTVLWATESLPGTKAVGETCCGPRGRGCGEGVASEVPLHYCQDVLLGPRMEEAVLACKTATVAGKGVGLGEESLL